MQRSHAADPETSASVRLRLTHEVAVDLDAARVALSDPTWLGKQVHDSTVAPGVRRFATDLELPLSEGYPSRAVRKAALVDLGSPVERGDALVLPVAWQSATLAPLFPVFSGSLTVRATGLALEGWYAPPMGKIGLLIDGALLRFVARRTAQAFLAGAAERLAG